MKDLFDKGKKFFENKEYDNSLKILLDIFESNSKNISVLIYISLNYMFKAEYNQALTFLNKIKKLNSNLPEIYFNKALCYANLGDEKKTIDNYNTAIQVNPKYKQAYMNLGVLYKNLGQIEKAIETYQRALDYVEMKEEIYINLSEAFKINNDPSNAKYYAIQALNINSSNSFALNNLGISLIDEGMLDEAISTLSKAVQINPQLALAFNNLGIAYEYKSDYSKAIESYKSAIKINPNYHDAFFNIGQIQLSTADLKNGWKNYEHRWGKTEKRPTRINFQKPQWNPSLGYEKILIWGEQGLGEQILFSSILETLKNKFKKIFLLLDDRLCQLFEEAHPCIKILKKTEKIDEEQFDYHLPICSLGLFFRDNLNNFAQKPVFNLDKEKSIFNISETKKFKCALSWKSTNPHTGIDKSVTLEGLKEILKINTIEFYNIQYTQEDKEINSFKNIYNIEIKNIEGLDTFNDIYRLTHFINQCDFVISISNTNAHLAASIGKPTFLLLTKERGKFWYWDQYKNDANAWYPSVKIFKQENAGEWGKPIRDLREYLITHY